MIMPNKIITIGKKKVRVEANASTLLIYEDRFKGRRLLQDIGELAKITKAEKIPFSLYSKLFWAAAKTADNSIPDIYDWIKDFEISDVIIGSQTVITLIYESIETTKKQKAAVIHRLICRLMTFLHLRSKAD